MLIIKNILRYGVLSYPEYKETWIFYKLEILKHGVLRLPGMQEDMDYWLALFCLYQIPNLKFLVANRVQQPIPRNPVPLGEIQDLFCKSCSVGIYFWFWAVYPFISINSIVALDQKKPLNKGVPYVVYFGKFLGIPMFR